MFEGWSDHPPTNLLLKAIVEGLGGGKATGTKQAELAVPPEAAEAMEKAALAEIRTKGAGRIPIVRGRDKGLPKTLPVFDIDAMRANNATTARALVKGKVRV